MRQLVVGDTGPINYLILIGLVDVLPDLFERVLLPDAVAVELCHPNAPAAVRQWMSEPPVWIEVRRPAGVDDESLAGLGSGEAAAILLAAEIRADLLLMDDRRGVLVAQSQGLEVTGTLGVLVEGAKLHRLNLAEAFERLKRTTFRCSQALYDHLLAEVGGDTGRSR